MGQHFDEIAMFINKKNITDNIYKRLQKESLKMVQQLSGNLWTDYNDHDPGVTIMDILNYALLDLEYLCSFPLAEYLSKEDFLSEHIGLLSPDILFAPSIVTTNDYTKLILDTFKEVQSCNVAVDNSLFSIHLKVVSGTDTNNITNKVTALYHKNRNLCENLYKITTEEVAEIQKDKINRKEDISFNPMIPVPNLLLQQNLKYRPVQYDFPDCYGVNEKGLPPNISPEHKVAIMQLKAYLLIFDYLLSGVNQQILSIPQFLNLSVGISPDFKADIDIPDIEYLLDESKAKQTEIFNREEKIIQKEFYLDSLDRMYGEDTSRYVKHIEDATERIALRVELIRNIPLINTVRLKSFDLSNTAYDNQSGIEQFLHMLLDISPDIVHDNKAVYIVEHMLLMDQNKNFGESNRLTLVFHDTIKQTSRAEIMNILEERLPAHILFDTIWLNSEEMAWFRSTYSSWRNVLATEDKIRIADYSNEIKKILFR